MISATTFAAQLALLLRYGDKAEARVELLIRRHHGPDELVGVAVGILVTNAIAELRSLGAGQA